MPHDRRWTVLAITAALAVAAATMSCRSDNEAPAVSAASSTEPDVSTPEGDPSNAAHWRYCSVDGFLASDCGGTVSSCPPGTQMSAVTWVGTCRNPADEKDYIISYNDCCGKGTCGRSFVHRNEGDKPVYYTHKSNDVMWCMGEADAGYNSTVAIVLGAADGPDH